MSDAQTPQRLSDKTLRVHSVSPSGRLLLAGNFQGKHLGGEMLLIWDTQTKKNLCPLKSLAFASLQHSPRTGSASQPKPDLSKYTMEQKIYHDQLMVDA